MAARAVLVVDAANVVGSRPDGWWRDRAGAARRLLERLTAADLDSDVVLVLEGRAREGAPAGRAGAVEVVHASGEGDDTVVAEVVAAGGAGVTVVTADRGLRARVVAAGAAVQGPGWLLDRI
ncbi:hypothetical protein [Desertihabitans aurantiacus]|uniref:hypothetical protein n=1 Tax=Desertihabitans aurantiacus TaxID=2282477 RepID=UPI000DF7FD7D|nr:hypothetical protein [Desertihabitans aurantiacus]